MANEGKSFQSVFEVHLAGWRNVRTGGGVDHQQDHDLRGACGACLHDRDRRRRVRGACESSRTVSAFSKQPEKETICQPFIVLSTPAIAYKFDMRPRGPPPRVIQPNANRSSTKVQFSTGKKTFVGKLERRRFDLDDSGGAARGGVAYLEGSW